MVRIQIHESKAAAARKLCFGRVGNAHCSVRLAVFALSDGGTFRWP